MAKLHLLKTEADFARFQRSRPQQTLALKIRIVPTVNQNFPRFGFIVPKKILPKVTDRNVVKRRLKAILAKHQGSLQPVDILLFPYRPALQKKFMDLEAETLQLFKRAGIWKS